MITFLLEYTVQIKQLGYAIVKVTNTWECSNSNTHFAKSRLMKEL